MKEPRKGVIRQLPAEPTQPQAKMKHVRSVNQNPRCDLPEAKRLLIVDDHPLFRKGLEELIHSDANFAVCGEADNAAEAMEVIRKLHPDMAIVDLSLPGANGIELIKNIRAEFPSLPVLVLSMHDESLYALRALRRVARPSWLPVINTGLEAGDARQTWTLAVLTAFFVLPVQPMALNELLELLCECAHPMMFFLICDISHHLTNI